MDLIDKLVDLKINEVQANLHLPSYMVFSLVIKKLAYM